MGMFDWYLPDPPLPCRWCGTLLDEFQGKDGPCNLLVWRENIAAPVDQRCDEEWRTATDLRDGLRLPEIFGVTGSCRACTNSSEFTCYTESATWVDCVLGDFRELGHPVAARDIGTGLRQCTKCAFVWEWPVERQMSECAECHSLTTLVAA
jgi:hypothetical protein